MARKHDFALPMPLAEYRCRFSRHALSMPPLKSQLGRRCFQLAHFSSSAGFATFSGRRCSTSASPSAMPRQAPSQDDTGRSLPTFLPARKAVDYRPAIAMLEIFAAGAADRRRRAADAHLRLRDCCRSLRFPPTAARRSRLPRRRDDASLI